MKNINSIYNFLSWTIISSQVSAAPSSSKSQPIQPQNADLERRQYLATNPQPQYIPQALSIASVRPAECKNCPWGSCLNARAIEPGTDVGFACWTTGEPINNDPTWIRHHYGTRLGDFCYVNPYDMSQSSSEWYKGKLPYCGSKSELNFYLPKATTRTELFTECSLCPFRDCEGMEFYQAGAELEINCVLKDGWEQVSPTHENGTKKYYRTNKNCYVSAASVKELPLIEGAEILPACGPVPHLKSTDRPTTDGALPLAPSQPLSLAPAAPALDLAPALAPAPVPVAPLDLSSGFKLPGEPKPAAAPPAKGKGFFGGRWRPWPRWQW